MSYFALLTFPMILKLYFRSYFFKFERKYIYGNDKNIGGDEIPLSMTPCVFQESLKLPIILKEKEGVEIQSSTYLSKVGCNPIFQKTIPINIQSTISYAFIKSTLIMHLFLLAIPLWYLLKSSLHMRILSPLFLPSTKVA